MNEIQMIPELKNCPFCGSYARFVYTIEGWPYAVYCARCKTKAEWAGVPDSPKTTTGEAMEYLAARWNRRAEEEQEAVEPSTDIARNRRCPKCFTILKGKFCHECGQKVKWNA